MATTTPGTHRIADGSAVPFDVALAGWVAAALPVLEGTARRYNAVITYGHLAKEIQVATGVRTRILIGNWIGRVLGAVAQQCHDRGEPNLASLCVHQDGTIGDGDGYGAGVEQTGDDAPVNIEVHAAEQRLACYRLHATDLPAGGGGLTIIPRRKQPAKAGGRAARPVAPALKVCPDCNMVLPMSGRCYTCANA